MARCRIFRTTRESRQPWRPRDWVPWMPILADSIPPRMCSRDRSRLLEVAARPAAKSTRPVDAGGRRPFHGAAFWGWNDVVQYLAAHGAKLDARDSQKMTAIDAAMGRAGGNSRGGQRIDVHEDVAGAAAETPRRLRPPSPGRITPPGDFFPLSLCFFAAAEQLRRPSGSRDRTAHGLRAPAPPEKAAPTERSPAAPSQAPVYFA